MNLAEMLLDHWLKCMEKSFSKFRNHVQSKKTASSMTLLLSKTSLENISLFLCFQIVHVTTIHHHFHLLALNPSTIDGSCCRKCIFGSFGKAADWLTHDDDSHHMGVTFLQWKNKWPASSTAFLHKGQLVSETSTCLLFGYMMEHG